MLPTESSRRRPKNMHSYKRREVKKTVHIAMDYPCIHCGCVETLCGNEVFNGDEWTDDPSKSNCKPCKKIMNLIDE